MDIFIEDQVYSPNNIIKNKITGLKEVSLTVKREDLLHTEVSGNKFRKLKYNIRSARELGFSTLLTFGGAFSNHIAATAAAGRLCGFKTIGVIRGEELGMDIKSTLSSNPTLRFAHEQGMQLRFVDRESYRLKDQTEFIDRLESEIGSFYLIPEGGSNTLAIKGCEEILSEDDKKYDFICCSAGTGATAAGLINSISDDQRVLVFSALKGDFLKAEITKYTTKRNWQLITDYCFGGYGKINAELIEFMNSFKKEQHFLLDPVYTGKMIFGIFDLIKKDYFPVGSKILAIHTGGLQGVPGMNLLLEKKGLPLIDL